MAETYLSATDAAALSDANELPNVVTIITSVANSGRRSVQITDLSATAQSSLAALGYTLTTDANNASLFTISW